MNQIKLQMIRYKILSKSYNNYAKTKSYNKNLNKAINPHLIKLPFTLEELKKIHEKQATRLDLPWMRGL